MAKAVDAALVDVPAGAYHSLVPKVADLQGIGKASVAVQ
jgi:hypothetical protein